MIAVGSLECSKPRACPSSCTATRNRSFPMKRGKGKKTFETIRIVTEITEVEDSAFERYFH